MNKNKLFSVLTSSMILFTSTTPTVLAVSDDNQNIENEESSLVEVLPEIEEGAQYDLLKNVQIFNEEETVTLSGSVPNTYQVVYINESAEEEVLAIDGEPFSIVLNNENESMLSIVNAEDNTSVVVIDLNTILADIETVVVEEDVEVEETSDEMEVVLEKEATEEQSEEKVEKSDNEVIIEDPIYEVREYDSLSTEFSFPRSSEVDALLHGEQVIEADQPMSATPGMSLFSTSSSRTHNNGIYTVRSGDTFNAVASSFNLSQRQLIEWNGHVSNINNIPVGTQLAVTRTGAERVLSDSDKARLYKGGATPVFSTNQGFIDTIAPMAIEVANQEGKEALWPSLMIAQAAHESAFGRSSLASPPYHNLSGIKGSHNGKSTLMWTWEVLGGVRVNVLAGFRHYPSYTASLEDYANLMRNGLSWNRRYYAGTWRSNTSSVWDVLNNEGLAGYATDPAYYNKIRNTINQYDLTKYDTGNYYVRTGFFLGEDYTQQQVNRLRNENSSFSYKMVRDENKAPYSYRRIESTQEFLGEVGAQRVVDQLKREQGWSASMIATGNSTQRYRVWSGFFNSLPEAERAQAQLAQSSGYSVMIERGNDNKYRLRTGFFNGRASADQGLKAMQALGWSGRVEGSSDSTPHYKVRTGTFNTPGHVSRAEDYFRKNGWGSRQVMDARNNYYYRIVIEGFSHEAQAKSYIDQLVKNHGWGATSFPVQK